MLRLISFYFTNLPINQNHFILGVSSLGILSDLSGLIDDGDDEDLSKVRLNHHHKRPHTSEPIKVDVNIQTDLKFSTINAIFKDYNDLINKDVVDVSIQVDRGNETWKVNSSTQTQVKKFVEKSIPSQSDLVITVTKSTSCKDLTQMKSVSSQSEEIGKSNKSISIQVTESQLPKENVRGGKRAHFKETNRFFSPCREMLDKTSNEGDITVFKEISTIGQEKTKQAISNGLYTYKLSTERKVSPKSKIPTSIGHQQALNCSNYQLTPSSSNASKSCPNTPSSPPESSPFHVHDQVPSPAGVLRSKSSNCINGKFSSGQECRSLQTDTADINHRHYSTSSSSSTSSIYEQSLNNKNRRSKTTVPLLSPLQEVSLTEDQRLFYDHRSRRPKTSPNLEVKTYLGCNNNPMADCGCSSGQSGPSMNSLSSPDLGIGDSDDHQDGGNLKACLSLQNYQKLRGLINESICVMNSLEGIQRDFSLSILNRAEFVTESSPHLTSLSMLLSTAKAIFKSIYIHDNCSKGTMNGVPEQGKKQTVSTSTMVKNDHDTEKLIAQLESLKLKKLKMERAISRQVQKTDKLLRKAAAISDLTE